jgi:PKHD-type hydroxylase
MLLTLPDILTADQIKAAQRLLGDADWVDGRDSAGAQARLVKNNEQLPHEAPAAQQIRAMVLSSLKHHPLFQSATLPKRFMTPRINRYGGETNAYGPHVDGAIRLVSPDERVRTDISCTVFLNDPADYDGGELSIRDTFGEHDIKLPAGHAVIYPGSSIHQVLPVTRGHRLACFFWIESMVRSDEKRRLLFDMDTALTALRQGGESPITVQLTGTYHNLLRMWAET